LPGRLDLRRARRGQVGLLGLEPLLDERVGLDGALQPAHDLGDHVAAQARRLHRDGRVHLVPVAEELLGAEVVALVGGTHDLVDGRLLSQRLGGTASERIWVAAASTWRLPSDSTTAPWPGRSVSKSSSASCSTLSSDWRRSQSSVACRKSLPPAKIASPAS